MTLKEVLKSKPSKPITCRITSLVCDAVTAMDSSNAGSILVLDEKDKIVGIFTERDIMHCFATNVSVRYEKIRNVMTPHPVTIESAEDVSAAIKVMSEKKIRHLPVVEKGKLIGVVSYRYLASRMLLM